MFDKAYLEKLQFTSPRIQEEHDLIWQCAKPHGYVLDVGCGNGRFGLFLQKNNFAKVVFSDVAVGAREYLKNEDFVLASMTDLPFSDSTFDQVYCLHVLAHIPNRKKAVQEAWRVLKPNGQLVIVTPNKYYVYFSWLVSWIKGKPIKYDETARWLYGKRQIKKLLKEWQVEVIRFQESPRKLPLRWLRPKLLVVATKRC